MKSIFTFCFLLVFSILSATPKPLTEELVIRLQEDEKLIGTFSGDIDQQTSLHLLVTKNKQDDQYLVKTYFIDANKNISALENAVFPEKPSVISYHLKDEVLTLLLQQGKKKEEKLEILEFSTVNGGLKRFSVENFEEPYLIMRGSEKTFLLNKKDEEIEIISITGALEPEKAILDFSGINRDTAEKFFKKKPEGINTAEFVAQGSINPSKLYYTHEKLVFDYKSEKEYFILSVEPDTGEQEIFKADFSDLDKVKEVNTYIYENKAFLFMNNREDIILRIYDIESQKLLREVKLREEFSANEDLKKLITKSSRKNFSLTATVNTGIENTLLVNLGAVPTYEYFYMYNWWWQHTMFHNMMMQQISIPKPQLPFGPNTAQDNDLYYYSAPRAVQLVMDKDLKFLKNSAGTPVRPQFDKDKYLDIFRNNEMLKEETISFTTGSVRAIYFSESTKSIHIKIFD
ncbi:hypothetical protein JRG66_15045 [Salinimicrobium tongyeongense]|uniref:Uncharacterized protein n=1 Tax=Salinimicrobium tongyeongense TaxID=2809707 RepID=A0ABY6NRY1_9FLAO|nr:hypothetical protein [Salinimicrobium tongyeongense]UZH55243.1 hypothetical protein JRG66_15045 [Salinimicrobium tongyeongense]